MRQRCAGLNRTGLAGPPQDNIAAEFSVAADAARQNRASRDYGLLNLDPVGQIHLRPFCGNTVTADLVCLNISLHDSDVPNVTPNHVVKVTCAVVPDLYDEFILTADVTSVTL